MKLSNKNKTSTALTLCALAGMAMQGILANCNHQLWEKSANSESVAKHSYEIATALVNKLKEEEK